MDLEELENKPKDLPEQLWASVPRGRLLKPQNLTFEYLTAFSVTCRTKKSEPISLISLPEKSWNNTRWINSIAFVIIIESRLNEE